MGEPKHVAFRWAVLTAVPLIVWLFVYPHANAYYHSLQADRALSGDDCAAALRHLQPCLRVWPGNARLQFAAARCRWREGDPEAAEGPLREAARLGWASKAIDVESILIEAQTALHPALEASLAELLRFAKADDSDLEAIVLEALVLAFLRAERRSEAVGAAKTLVHQHAGRWRAQRLLGQALEGQDPDVAAAAYQRSLALWPAQPRVHRWLAIYQARVGNPRETLEHLRAAGAADVEATLAEAKARLLLGQLVEARSALDRAWRQGAEKMPWAWTLRGRLELEQHGPAEATPWLKRAEAVAPYNRETVDALVALAAREGCTEKARHYQLRKQQSKDANEEVDRISKQMDRLHRQANADPKDKEALAYRMGQLLFLTDHDETAVKWMKSVLATNPGHAGAHQALADYYQRVGAAAQADEHRRSLAKETGQP